MCQRLYIASRTELTPMSKRKDAPYLGVRLLEGDREAFRQALPAEEFPYLYAAEAFATCGCGFPEALEGRERRKGDPEAIHTLRRLVEVLRPAVKSRPRVKLLLSFLGDEDEPTSEGRTIGLDDLQSPGFRFQHHEILTVLKEPQNDRMQLTGSAPAGNRGPRS
jgi:hypothetical protein